MFKKLDKFMKIRLHLSTLKDEISLSLFSLAMGAYVEENKLSGGGFYCPISSKLKPGPTAPSSKYFYGYLIGFTIICVAYRGGSKDQAHKLIIKLIQEEDKHSSSHVRINFVKLCLLESNMVLDSRPDLQQLCNGMATGWYDAKLINAHGFPDRKRIGDNSLHDGNMWTEVQFPLLRKYLLTGEEFTESFCYQE